MILVFPRPRCLMQRLNWRAHQVAFTLVSQPVKNIRINIYSLFNFLYYTSKSFIGSRGIYIFIYFQLLKLKSVIFSLINQKTNVINFEVQKIKVETTLDTATEAGGEFLSSNSAQKRNANCEFRVIPHSKERGVSLPSLLRVGNVGVRKPQIYIENLKVNRTCLEHLFESSNHHQNKERFFVYANVVFKIGYYGR